MKDLLLNHFLSVTLEEKSGKKIEVDLPLALFEDRINELVESEIDSNSEISDEDSKPVSLRLTGGIGRDVLINTTTFSPDLCEGVTGDITVDNFKEFAINNSFEETVEYCQSLAAKLNIDESSLGEQITNKNGITFYCPDSDIAFRFGMLNEDDLAVDIKELIDDCYSDNYVELFGKYDKAYAFVAHYVQEKGESLSSFYESDFMFLDFDSEALSKVPVIPSFVKGL